MLNLFEKKVKTPEGEMPKAKPNFNTYIDPTGELDSKSFKRSLWLVQHKVGLYRVGMIFGIAVAAVTWGFTLVSVGYYLIFGLRQDLKLQAESTQFINYSGLAAVYAPKELQLGSAFTLPGGTNKMDALAQVTNPNSSWVAMFDYVYEVSDVTTSVHSATVLPGSTTFIAELGLPATANSAVPTIKNLQWKRISGHQIPDMAKWLAERQNFTVDNLTVGAPGQDLSSDVPATSIRFTIKNETAFGFRQPHFLVALQKQGSIVGIVPLAFDSFASLEVKSVDLRSFVPNISIDGVELIPQINVFDNSVYTAPPA